MHHRVPRRERLDLELARAAGAEVLADPLQARVGTVLFPVFHTLSGSGQNAHYLIVGWVGFHLDSFTVHGNSATLNGSFTTYIAHGIQATAGSSQPDFGVRSIQLIG